MPTLKPKSRLGRGLSSLISVSEPASEPLVSAEEPAPPQAAERTQDVPSVPPQTSDGQTQFPELPIDSIVPNPHQPRKRFDEASLLTLAASIKSTGLIQPIVVRRTPGSTTQYQLVAGERRLRAAKAAGLLLIPALVREVDSFKQAQMALIENVQREDLNPIDRAQAYRTLMDQLGLTQAELASRVGEDRSSIANHLRLLDLAEPVRELVRTAQLTQGHAKILAGITDPVHQQELAERIIGQDLSVRNLERILQEVPAAPAKSPAPEPSAHIKDLERSLTSQLGLRVQLRTGGKGRGRLVIHYSSLDQFDTLIERLGVKPE